MKKLGVFVIILILFSTIFINPVSGEVKQDDASIELRMLVVVLGTVNICFEENELYGFATIGYTDGATFIFQRYSINFEGIPFFLQKGIGLSICIYNPADL
jgi:hypothetical protein